MVMRLTLRCEAETIRKFGEQTENFPVKRGPAAPSGGKGQKNEVKSLAGLWAGRRPRATSAIRRLVRASNHHRWIAIDGRQSSRSTSARIVTRGKPSVCRQ